MFEDIGRRPDQRADQDVYSSHSAKWVIFLLGWKDNYCQLRGEYVSGPGETKQTIVYISYHGHQSMHFNFTVSIVLIERAEQRVGIACLVAGISVWWVREGSESVRVCVLFVLI